MTTTDEKFFAWLDGELDDAEASEMEALVACDPELAALAQQHRALGARLSTAFGTIAEAPVPERLAATVRPPSGEVVDIAAARERRRDNWGQSSQWMAMAATLAIGIVTGTMLQTGGGSDPVELRDGRMYAAAALDRSLDGQLASAAAGDVRVGVTFRDQSGAICRSFSGAESSGLACRQGDDWQVRGLFAAPEGQGGDYRMAAGTDPSLAALIDSSIAGEPFDAAQEKAARERGWR